MRALRNWGREEGDAASVEGSGASFPRHPTSSLLMSSSNDEAAPLRSEAEEEGGARRLSTLTKFSYGVGEFGLTVSSSVQGFFLNSFLLEVVGMQASYAGSLLLFTHLLDAVSDPLVGVLSDRGRCRMGRRRAWILGAVLPFVLSYIFLWYVPELVARSPSSSFAYYLGLALLHSITYTCVSLPYSALAPELTSDYDERTSLMTFKVGVMSVTMITATFAQSLLIDAFPRPATGYLVAGVAFGLLMLLPFLLTFCCIRERPAPPKSRRRRTSCSSSLQGIRVMASNRPFVAVMFMYLTSQLAIQFVQNNLILWVKYALDRENQFSFLLLCFQGVAFVCLPLWERLSRRIGKKRVFYVGGVFMICVLVFAFYLSELSRSASDVLVWLVGCLAGAGLSVMMLIPVAMFPDVIEADELATGQRREGLFYSMFVFFQKLGLAGALAISNFVLASAGYLSPEEMARLQLPQSSGAIFALRVMVGPVPAVVLSLSLLAAYFYPLTSDLHRAMVDELDARRMDDQSDRE